MVILNDFVLIQVPPDRVWTWLSELPSHYRDWHPDHVVCRYEHGSSLRVGTVLYVEECLHGRLHRLRMRATEVVPGSKLRYRSGVFGGEFLVTPEGNGTRFTATLSFGSRVRVLGSALDAVIRRLLRRRLEALEAHMREEGENLKRLLEQERNA